MPSSSASDREPPRASARPPRRSVASPTFSTCPASPCEQPLLPDPSPCRIHPIATVYLRVRAQPPRSPCTRARARTHAESRALDRALATHRTCARAPQLHPARAPADTLRHASLATMPEANSTSSSSSIYNRSCSRTRARTHTGPRPHRRSVAVASAVDGSLLTGLTQRSAHLSLIAGYPASSRKCFCLLIPS